MKMFQCISTPVWWVVIGLLGLAANNPARAQPNQTLPAGVLHALGRVNVPTDALSLLLVDAQGLQAPRLSHRARVAVNPASVMKLVTTLAALDLLGPQFSWKTPVYLEGRISGQILYGTVYIQGRGDPKLVMERLWLLMRRLQGLGIRQIEGDLVLDRSLFETAATDPGNFDGERLRPYNATPEALLLNFSSMVMTFTPDQQAQVARVQIDPPLAGLDFAATVPLAKTPCTDYRAALQADFSDPMRVRFAGSYPAACGERSWPVASADPANFSARAVEGMWRAIGGQLTGAVRYGTVPEALKTSGAAFEMVSPTLGEVIRDINKFSNNVMAQQLFLTLGLQLRQQGSLQAAREVVTDWWQQHWGLQSVPVMDNGSGLSRHERISAAALARMLQWAWQSPLMPELVASLPIAGVDGTLKNRPLGNHTAAGAHLKTGSLRDVVALAGYLDLPASADRSGRREVLVAIINHPNAQAARPALQAAVDWALLP
jgi:D-alanyl-D-alanine carboxypeptidase/D-alanyl-D-alanine-endopeptidase (penicillin-binding protein 4)